MTNSFIKKESKLLKYQFWYIYLVHTRHCIFNSIFSIYCVNKLNTSKVLLIYVSARFFTSTEIMPQI